MGLECLRGDGCCSMEPRSPACCFSYSQGSCTCCCCAPLEHPSKCIVNVRLGIAIYGVIGAVMVFFTFGFQFHNWHCAVWGLVSGIFAAQSVFVEARYKLTKWRSKSYLLMATSSTACCGLVAGLTAFPIYLAYAILEKQGVTAENRSFYVASVWCALTFKNSLFLLISSLTYYYLNKSQDKNHSNSVSLNDTSS